MPPPASPPCASENKEDDNASFLRTGEEAFNAVYAQSFKRANDIFVHEQPDALTFNPHQDMTSLSSAQVSQAFQFFTGMYCYAMSETAKVDAETVAVEFRMRVIAKTITVHHAGTKQKKYDVDAVIATDKQYVALSEKKAMLQVQRIALEATTKGLEEKAACLSRELTRRETESRIAPRAR